MHTSHLGDHLINVTQGTATKLSKIDSIKRIIQRQRSVANNVHPQPTSLGDLVLPVEYQQTMKGDQFLLYDSGQEQSQRFLILGTHKNVEMLRNSQIWLVDGTCKSAPSLLHK